MRHCCRRSAAGGQDAATGGALDLLCCSLWTLPPTLSCTMAQPTPGGTQAGWGSGGDTGMTAEEQAGDWLGREPLVAPHIIDPAGAAPKALAAGVPPPDAGAAALDASGNAVQGLHQVFKA